MPTTQPSSGAPLRALVAALGPAVALGVAAALPARASSHHLDYLHIEANEGGSSGGHVALRVGDWAYHFQHRDGWLQMQRDSWDRFEFVYRTLQNRDIALSRVETSEETWQLVRRGFQRRYLAQQRQLGVLGRLERDVRLLEQLSEDRGEGAAEGFPVAGAGFFRAEVAPGEDPPRALGRLRERIRERHGDGFLARRRHEIRAELAALTPVAPEVDAIGVAPGHYPAPPESFSERYAELRAGWLALDLLEWPRGLDPRALVSEPSASLAEADLARLREIQVALSEGAARLAGSPRPDWGYALLLAMARLAALEHSLETGRPVFLDALPAAASRVRVTPRRREVLPEVLEEARADRAAAWSRLLSAERFDEGDWSRLEAAATRVAELRRATRGAPELRVHAGSLLPEGWGPLPLRPVSHLGAHFDLEERLAEARAARDGYRESLRAHHRYHLLARNCVSEIFRTLDASLAAEGGALPVEEASRRRLGGHVHPVDGLNFIPFVSAQRVRERYRVAAQLELPSYRSFHLAAMREREGRLRVTLRESNVFTSTLYSPAEEDGFFVFFTDRGTWLRPLLGAANLTAALVKSGAGLALLPFDRGRALRSGIEGAVFSLPELAFVNLRKGSNEYVPPERRPPPSRPPEAG